jgi:hypothetical protein
VQEGRQWHVCDVVSMTLTTSDHHHIPPFPSFYQAVKDNQSRTGGPARVSSPFLRLDKNYNSAPRLQCFVQISHHTIVFFPKLSSVRIINKSAVNFTV